MRINNGAYSVSDGFIVHMLCVAADTVYVVSGSRWCICGETQPTAAYIVSGSRWCMHCQWQLMMHAL